MLKKILFVILMMTGINANAQNQTWNATGIDGVNYNIDSIVNTGKTVLVDISANWCNPCWDFHLSGILEKLWAEFGPNGTNDLFIIFVDGDPASSIANLSGVGPQAMGNWIATTPYPIIGPYGQGAAVQSHYNMNGYPTLFVHCPGTANGQSIPMGTTWESFLQSWNATCPAPFPLINGVVDPTLLHSEEEYYCEGDHPKTEIFNQGSDSLFAATLEVSTGGSILQTKNWTGSLAPFTHEEVEFENVNIVDGVVYEYNVSSAGETYTTGNADNGSYLIAREAPTSDMTLDLQCNSSAAQTKWKLLDANDNIVAENPSANYQYNRFYTYDWNLTPNSCYTFIISNIYMEGICCRLGNGYYNIRSTADSTISFQFGSSWVGLEEVTTFHTPVNTGIDGVNSLSEIELFPNPSSGMITIKVKNSDEHLFNLFNVFNVLGEAVKSDKVVNNEIDLSSLQSGIYFLKLNSEKNSIVKKITISK